MARYTEWLLEVAAGKIGIDGHLYGHQADLEPGDKASSNG
jgi:hypothetical protein